MNRKIFFSAISILASLTLMTGSAFAAFTTTATAAGNTFSTTTPNLEITLNGQTGTVVTGTSVAGLIPGIAGATQTFVLTNTDPNVSGDLAVSLKLPFEQTNTLSGDDLNITVNCGSGDISDSYSGWIYNGHSLGTVKAQNGQLTCTMIPTLNSGIGNTDIGKSAVFDAVFTGTEGN